MGGGCKSNADPDPHRPLFFKLQVDLLPLSLSLFFFEFHSFNCFIIFFQFKGSLNPAKFLLKTLFFKNHAVI